MIVNPHGKAQKFPHNLDKLSDPRPQVGWWEGG